MTTKDKLKVSHAAEGINLFNHINTTSLKVFYATLTVPLFLVLVTVLKQP